MTGPPLARSGVDRAAHLRSDREWLEAAWWRSRVLLINSAGRTLCSAEPALVFVAPQDAPAAQRLFLGVDPAGSPYFAVMAAQLPEVAGAREVSLREVGALLSHRDAGLFVTAAALANWHAGHAYSPASGLETVIADCGWLRVDPAGGHVFPRTDPAIIVLVHDGVAGPDGRCLLGNNAAWPVRDRRRFFSTLAGFVEPGESAEAAVAREVHEEVGVEVTALRYEGSQAWPFPGSLMLGFTGLADSAAPLRVDEQEIAEAGWFTRTQIEELLPALPDPGGAPHGVATPGAEMALPGPASIAHYLIRTWLARG